MGSRCCGAPAATPPRRAPRPPWSTGCPGGRSTRALRRTSLDLDGAALPDPYRAKVAGNDCDDSDATFWRWTVLYPDSDADGIGSPPREIRCLGESIPPGYSLQGWDADEGDPAVQAGAPDAVDVLSL